MRSNPSNPCQTLTPGHPCRWARRARRRGLLIGNSREWAARQDPLNGSAKAGLSFVERPAIASKLRLNIGYLSLRLVELAGQFQALALLSLQEGFVFGFKLPLGKLRRLELCGQGLIERTRVCNTCRALGD